MISYYPDMVFWEYDGENMKPISSFRWNRGYGSYHPKFLIKKGDLVICVASQYPGEAGKKRCIFGSVDGGYHWKPFLMGDDIGYSTTEIKKNKIPVSSVEDSLSVLFMNEDKINILTLKKKQE